ncbi:2-polyprenyl-3-methyl-5-hydroxy-6-metoxy-1,4-benzoquinol methylase [Halothiobacillus diazotrophicus]|uniref:2-polyprenyl-3-methyl-5-hydroxy-6-metoxy-1, 4-benzoquinol methylase n=1 Tax=Halothiobacillus diazotrophicus TaxID=1860122 RepID=A0A191ZEX9_9GAMM|nr:class I SAM-dependent methyltransferase [Halothiobacillus diazotrophicus]ANJ66417.1 2-polyprenyl-3-methyl-5-hydroxy-6-metoxy-1,4-benzoquinol methylase [Halothiobacillus diazotrophicus]
MTTQHMMIQNPDIHTVVDETQIYRELLPLEGADIIELGCGAAKHTRTIAETGHPASILACEVDTRQHEKNLAITDLPTVKFVLAGAQAIPAPDASADIVMMFKSLHHVPMDLMDTAFSEIARVLRPGGLAYISEPVYAGDFNEVLRLFNDEAIVRQAAFDAVRRAVDRGVMELVEQRFFNTPNRFENFADFEQRIMQVTHSEFRISPELHEQIRQRFADFVGADGANFVMPIRVDLLRRPAV